MNNYEPVIGIEVHVELNTKTKMFCRCSGDYFGKPPNTHTCPVCLGLPGTLPYINEEAIKKCIQIGLALNCSTVENSLFERKNYFYPDLPKGYQISQYQLPLCVNGQLEVEDLDGSVSMIRINRTHQEEDTGKLTHLGGKTLVDFNRSGVPLVEVVTEPDFTSSAQVKDYAKKLQQIFRYLGVSNADMERGDMRLEANVSVRKIYPSASPQDDKSLPAYRVELKNINSFRFMQAAIEYEIKRQIAALEHGEKLTQETRGWNEAKKETFLQRSKEVAHDYRYFPEPDLPELQVDRLQVTVDSIKQGMLELPTNKKMRFEKEYDLNKQQAVILAETEKLADYFEKAVEAGKSHNVTPTQLANYIINKKVDITKVSHEGIISEIAKKGVGVISDESELEGLAKRALTENPTVVADYVRGKQNALQALIGAVMKKSSGKAEASKVKAILVKLIEYLK